LYISYKGALFPEDTDAKDKEQPEAGASVSSNTPSFDSSPIGSFSYEGANLFEARIVEINTNGVTLRDKHGKAVTVPLDIAAKKPDLRMRAKEAMEALLASPQ